MTVLAQGIVGLLVVAASGCQPPQERTPGLFALVARVAVGEGPSAVAAGDLNGDGHQDLVVANTRSDSLTLLEGLGTGEFKTGAEVPAGENPVDLVLGDFDEDGDLDAAVANHETRYATLLWNDGKGELAPSEASRLALDIGPHPHAIRAADLDSDGHLDLLIDDREGESLSLLLGLGTGQFSASARRIAVGGDPYRGMAIGDLNTDGWSDLVTPNRSEVAVVLGGPELHFGEPRGLAADRPFAVELADLNGDKALDLVLATEPGVVRVLLGDGSGSFSRTEGWYEGDTLAGAKAIAVGDFNGDGRKDAAIQNFSSSPVLVLLGGEERVVSLEVIVGRNPWGLAASDLTADGRDDLVVLDHAGGEAWIYVSVSGTR